MNIYNAMNTAKWALLTHQTAIEVTGQNIANVNNPNYNRQEVLMEASFPVNEGDNLIGTGVRIQSITRRFDEYLYNQKLESNFNLNRWQARENVMSRVDVVLNESGGDGINAKLSELFQSFYNLSNNPNGAVERRDVVEKGVSLANKMNYVGNELQRIRRDTDTKITGSMSQINNITSEIVNLNKRIHEAEVNGNTANDYRDRREELISNLSTMVDVHYFEQSNHEVVVMMNSGRPLVVGQSSFNLSAQVSPNDPQVHNILWRDASGNNTDVTSEFVGGQLGAWLEMRDTDIYNILDDFNTLAASIVKEVNRLHSSGFSLDGTTGTNFFNGLTPGGRAGARNTGGAVLGSGSVMNPETVNTDHYRLTFDGAGNYSVYNLDKQSASGTYSFSSGSPLGFFTARGISIAITGSPASGDTFDISGADNAAFNFGVNSAVVNNLDKVAAGATRNAGDGVQARRIGDLQYQRWIGGNWNTSGAIAGVYSASGSYTFDEWYASVVGGVGASASEAKSSRALQEAVDNQLVGLREQVSGVALDEEMINLVKFQHAYGAASKMITVVDELLQTLLNLK